MIMGINVPDMPDLDGYYPRIADQRSSRGSENLGDEKFLYDRTVGGTSLEQFKYTGQLCAAHAPALTKA